MGVEFLSCKNCGDTFPDCGSYVRCECGMKWCDKDCAESDGWQYEYNEKGDYEEITCNYCRHEDYSDSELLRYALKLLNFSREYLIDMYNEYKGT